MAAFIFGEKIDFNIVPNPEPGGFVIGYDLDGVLKQKDEFGVITKIGGGSGNLAATLAQGNHSGTYSVVLDNGSYIINDTNTNKINLNNSAISLTTDNELYTQSYLYLTSTDAILANAGSSFRIEDNALKLIYDVNNNQILTNNSYKLRVNNNTVLEFSYGGLIASPGSRANAIISSDGSVINTGLINTVVVGGVNITATQSNSVYLPSLYIQDSKFIRGTNGSVFMSGKSVIGIQESTSTILTNNGILLKDTATQSTSPNLDSGITYISSKNSRNNAGIKNTVVVGGTNINATASDTVYLGNKVNINNLYTLPTTDGSAGQTMKTDGQGNLTWGSQDSGASITLNYVQFRADYENKVLAKNATYLIVDADKALYDNVNGTEVYLSTDGYGNVQDNSYGKFWNPKYDKNEPGYGIFKEYQTYNLNDTTIWGGYYWIRVTPAPGTGTVVDLFNLDSNWVKIPFGNTYYNLSYDPIKYDISTNRIVSRSDNFNNAVVTSSENIDYWINTMSLHNPIKAFQWGNGYDGVNGISGNILVDSYNENINFIGSYQVSLNFVNKSYQSNIVFGVSASQSNFLFSNSSYQNNINFSGSSSQINITLNNNSSQENLDDVSNSYVQDGLSLNNFNNDRTSRPLSNNESFTAIANDVVIDGNLRVTGTTSTINSVNLTIQDPIILLAASQSGSSLDSGLIINRGDLDNTAFIWDESEDEFAFISTDDDATTSGDINILGYENIRANSYIVDGGVSTQFLKADGSLDLTTYAVDSTVVHIYGTESIIGQKTFTPPVNTSGFIVTMPMVDNSPTGGVPDAERIYTRGHNGSSTSNVSGIYHVAYGNKNAGYTFINLSTDPDLTNSFGVDIKFKDNSTTNTIIRGQKGLTTSFIVTDSGNLLANVIAKIGGLSTQFLKADGSIDSNVYLTTESDTLQTVSGRGSTTTANITAASFVKSGGLGTQFLKANGTVDSNVYLTSYTETDTLQTVATRGAVTTTSITAASFIKTGGSATQFLKADGTSDSNVYAVDSNVVHKTGTETIFGDKIFSNSSGLNGVYFQNNVNYGGNYAFEGFCFSGGHGVARFTHNGISTSTFNLNLVNNSGGQNLVLDAVTATTGNAIVSRHNATPTFTLDKLGNLTGNTFVKSGGLGTQFLKADGTIDSNVYLTSYTETDTLQTVTTRGAVTTTSITAASFIKTGGLGTQYLMADGTTMEISPQVTVSASTVYLDDTYHGKIVKVKGVSTIFVPGSLRAGFNCVFRVFTSANALFLGTQSGVIESSGQNLTEGKTATMFKDTDTSFTYVIAGDLT